MYEPIIDPMIFYWMDILNNIKSLPFSLFILLIIFSGGACVTYTDYSKEQAPVHRVVHRVAKRIAICLLILCPISASLSFFIPSKDTMYKMLIAKQVTPHTLQVTGETAEVIVDKISDKLINVIQEVKK